MDYYTIIFNAAQIAERIECMISDYRVSNLESNLTRQATTWDEKIQIPNLELRCNESRAEANVKTENREKEYAGLMGAWSHAQYAGQRERE